MNGEHSILNHYNLTSPYPTSWPAEKDESDASEDEKPNDDLSKAGIRRSRSRYSALERSESDRRSLVPGSQKLRDGQENLVQKDEPDPLGAADSVIRILRQRGLPVEEESRLRTSCTAMNERSLIVYRKQIPPVVYHILTKPLSLTGSLECLYTASCSGPSIPLPINRPEIRIVESAGGIKFRTFRPCKDHN